MWTWLDKLLGRTTNDEVLELKRQVQSLRLDLEEATQLTERLKEDLARQRSGADAEVTDAVDAQIEQLVSDAAAPVSQLLTQAYLVEEGQSVRAQDVLTVARRLVRSLERMGLRPEGRVGERVSFDPDRHEPLSATTSLAPSQPVVIRFVGMAYQGRILHKASVEPAAEA